ncbi:MAG: pentapeptide repeat-containing protein [Desulfobulbaceae bacterium]|nr:pentapeptide repeat-containing protein [Desulfobulbaceae bacterium]
MGSPSVSPSEEVRLNFQQLMETNSCPGCNLAGAVFNRLDLSGANLEGANLAGAQLYLANLVGTNLQNANLQGAALGGADLADADLRGANLTGAVIEGAYLVGARMDGTIITRRPHLDEGGPDAGETVYVDDEASSKNLPFTNKAYVAGSQDTENVEASDEPAEQKQVDAEVEKPVQEGKEQAVKPDKSRMEDMASVPGPLPGNSKKLVMMADAVVSQDSQDAEIKTGTAVSQPEEIDHEKLSSGDEKQEAMVPPAPQLQSQDMEEVEKAMPAASMAGDTEEADRKTAEDQARAGEMQAQPEVSLEKPDADQTAREAVDIQQVVDEPHEDIAAVEEVQAEPQQVTRLDKDAVVAEVVAPGKTVVTQEMEANEQQASPDLPVGKESVAGEEKTAMEPQKADVQDLVQEEIMPPEQVQEQENAGADTEIKEPAQPEQVTAEEVSAVEEAIKTADEQKKMLVEKLLDDNRCVECDLSGVDLSGRNLDEADLERANLQGANLSGADLSEANLKGVDFRGADLRNADLREADLYRANLSEADLTGARFEEAMIDMVFSTGAIGANFEGALTEE